MPLDKRVLTVEFVVSEAILSITEFFAAIFCPNDPTLVTRDGSNFDYLEFAAFWLRLEDAKLLESK